MKHKTPVLMTAENPEGWKLEELAGGQRFTVEFAEDNPFTVSAPPGEIS
jgi:hypothetical protein